LGPRLCSRALLSAPSRPSRSGLAEMRLSLGCGRLGRGALRPALSVPSVRQVIAGSRGAMAAGSLKVARFIFG
jgi:hypothetical protein